MVKQSNQLVSSLQSEASSSINASPIDPSISKQPASLFPGAQLKQVRNNRESCFPSQSPSSRACPNQSRRRRATTRRRRRGARQRWGLRNADGDVEGLWRAASGTEACGAHRLIGGCRRRGLARTGSRGR
uniref:Uncharacterized protein n=1 Tax=Setaria viridis TaxID=4556 RepID=A0A4U6VQ30_SETVI|nr:hypothetical protein SEVIR_2G046500v2 [Setaria viridis]